MRLKRLGQLGAAVVVAALAVDACNEQAKSPTGPGASQPPADQSAVVVSGPIGSTLAPLPPDRSIGPGHTVMSSSGFGVDGASYVSFPSGSLPDADSIEVRNLTLGVVVGSRVVDGGVDPMAISALVGDSLEISVFREDQLLEVKARIVPDRIPPKIVRTDPSPGRRRVPLNAQIIVVFSEPMDPATIRPEVIHLMRRGEPVPGTVALEPNGWEARFTPAAHLDSLADYQLVVSTDAAGFGGERLEETATISFSTGTELLAVTTIARTVFPTLYRGQTEILGMAYPSDDAGRLVVEAPVHWSSTDSTIVHIDSTRLGASGVTSVWFTARSVGSTQLITSLGGIVDTAQVMVVESIRFADITVGDSATCGRDADGQAYCWGRYHMAGYPAHPASGVPLPYAQGHQVRGIAIGNKQGCAILASQSENAGCWGAFRTGQGWYLVIGGIVPLEAGRVSAHSYTSIVAGGRAGTPFVHACGVEVEGRAFCWGNNLEGQLGDGQTYFSSDFWDYDANRSDIQPVAVAGGHSFRSLTAGGDHTCGITTGGQAYCWGNNAAGQLGFSVPGGSATPGSVSGGSSFLALDAGQDHTCGLTLGGAASCWGANGSGQLGASGSGSSTPVTVQGGLTFTKLSSGGLHTCAVTSSGEAYCWGENSSGQLGNGTTSNSNSPVPVQGGLTFVSVSAGGAHTCGMSTEGSAYCWGENSVGQLGINTTTNRLTPAVVMGRP